MIEARWRSGPGPMADGEAYPQPALGYLLELRLKVRGIPEATAIVDRCLALVARAEDADPETLAELYREAARIGDGLALRFGTPRSAVRQ